MKNTKFLLKEQEQYNNTRNTDIFSPSSVSSNKISKIHKQEAMQTFCGRNFKYFFLVMTLNVEHIRTDIVTGHLCI